MNRPSSERFEQLVRALHAPVFRSARRICADDSAAADVVQEVFSRVWTGQVQLDQAANERAMLCWLAARLATNALRAARRRAKHEATAMQCTDRSNSDVLDAAANSDLHRVTAAFVRELPDALRVPLLMRHQDDLTLAAIGSALALPTSTVHDRIQQALERLRARLADRNQSVALAALPGLVAGVEGGPSPVGLEAKLLALPKVVPVAASATKLVAGPFAAALVLIGIVFASEEGGHNLPADAPVVVATSPVAVPQDPPGQVPGPPERRPLTGMNSSPGSSAGAVQEPATMVLATFSGTVRDADAWPVVGATVQVVAGGGLKPFPLGTPTSTDARGAFTVMATEGWLRPQAVRLVVREKDRVLLTTGDFAAPRPAAGAPLELVLPAKVGTEASRFELAIDVRDEAGLVLEGVEAHLYSATEPARPAFGAREGTATTGANGQAVLAGRGLGTKWLLVDGRPLHRESSFTKVTIAGPGPQPVRVVLNRGGELLVGVKSVTGRELDWHEPWLVDERTGLRVDGVAEQGLFRFRGLGGGPYSVFANGDRGCSPAARRGVLAGAEPVHFLLKDQTDERGVGDHLAELHGELVDSETGGVIEFGPFAVDVMPLIADGSSLVADGIEPPAPAQRAAPSGRHQRFHLTGLVPGRHAIVVSVPGYALATPSFELAADTVQTGIRIPLQRQAVVRGRVVDAGGQAIQGATVFVLGTGPLADKLAEGWTMHRERDAQPGEREVSFIPLRGYCNADGDFAIPQVPPGVDLRLVARHDDHGLVVVPLPPLRPGQELLDFEVQLER